MMEERDEGPTFQQPVAMTPTIPRQATAVLDKDGKSLRLRRRGEQLRYLRRRRGVIHVT